MNVSKCVLFIACLIGALSRPAIAAEGHAPDPGAVATRPVIAIIIDDVGENFQHGRRAIDLPGPLAYSFLPYMDYVQPLAVMAHQHHKEVMLHLPMQAVDGRDIGPGGLTLDMTENELIRTVAADLQAVPYVEGINNHMGSLLTQNPGTMSWLMHAITNHGNLFFVDSRTTEMTVAQQVANENSVPNLRRDVFLDDDLTSRAIAHQFRRLLAVARRQGWALAIGHPHPATLAYLEKRLPRLTRDGVDLVPVSYLIRRFSPWPPRPAANLRMVHSDTQ
jgi:polysaccharide deacetylase 2 family uncharacterized protein YibQ